MELDCLNCSKMILVGDLNFSLGEARTWGPNTIKDPSSDFFLRLLDEKGLVDIPPTHLIPNWSNKRVGDGFVSKILDRFLINDNALQMAPSIHQWIGDDEPSDHQPVFMDFKFLPDKLATPFKLNAY